MRAVQSVEQIAFADVILLNKTDLVDDAHQQRIKSRIKVGRQYFLHAAFPLLGKA